jgi:hypothetical protein
MPLCGMIIFDSREGLDFACTFFSLVVDGLNNKEKIKTKEPYAL